MTKFEDVKRKMVARRSLEVAQGKTGGRDPNATMCLNIQEITELFLWSLKHECAFRVNDVQPIIEFHTNSSGIGSTTICICECGAKRDITDLDAW